MATKPNTLTPSWSVLVGANVKQPKRRCWVIVTGGWANPDVTYWQLDSNCFSLMIMRPAGPPERVVMGPSYQTMLMRRRHLDFLKPLCCPGPRQLGFSLVLGSHQQVWTMALPPNGEIPWGCVRSWHSRAVCLVRDSSVLPLLSRKLVSSCWDWRAFVSLHEQEE